MLGRALTSWPACDQICDKVLLRLGVVRNDAFGLFKRSVFRWIDSVQQKNERRKLDIAAEKFEKAPELAG